MEDSISLNKGGSAAEFQMIIQRDSDQPVYLQLANIMRQQILAGIFQPGEQLPSEAKLIETYNVSPMTIRRAINLLAAQGIIFTVPGRGTFVKEVQLANAAFHLQDLKELFNNDGTTVVKLIAARFLLADERISRKLLIKPGSRVIFIRRLLTVEEKPAFYHRGYLIYDPNRPVVESEFQVTDLKGLFRGSGNPLIKSGELSLEATVIKEEEANLLQIPVNTPGMVLEHTFYDFKDKPLSWGWFVCSNQHLRLYTRIGFEQTYETRDERAR
jgi:GntR family transcriptional regulator